MNKKEKMKLRYQVRLNTIKARGKYFENPGVVRKLERQIRNCDK